MQKEKQLKSCCKNSLSSPKVFIGDLQRTRRFATATTTTIVEDSRALAGRATSGMTTLFDNDLGPVSARTARTGDPLLSGFTLIELLVIVLLIGILAAVALPQYQKAVTKSKFASLKIMTKSLSEAEQIYYLANGNYTTKISELSIEPGGTPNQTDNKRTFPWGECSVTLSAEDNKYVRCTNTQINMIYQIYMNGQVLCVANRADSVQNMVCKQETKRNTWSDSSDSKYIWYYK